MIAGANGSGKSTFSTVSRDDGLLVIDPDAIGREHGLSAIAAGRKTLAIEHDNLDAGRSLTVETTLSGRRYLAMIEDTRARGYRIEFVYIGTGDIAINLERIQRRVAGGGHDVPEADVRRRAERGLNHAQIVAATADYAIIFDNSGATMVPIIDRERDEIHVYRETPQWAKRIVAAMTGDRTAR